MKKTFERLGKQIAYHFDEPLLCNLITEALNDAYEDGKTEGAKVNPMTFATTGLFRGKPFSYWIELEANALKYGLDKLIQPFDAAKVYELILRFVSARAEWRKFYPEAAPYPVWKNMDQARDALLEAIEIEE